MKKQMTFRNHQASRSAEARSGFSLVEIMIGLMIFGLLMGYAVPNVFNSMTYARVERGASRLSFQMQQARSYALANNQSVWLDVDTGTNELTVWIDADRDGTRDSGEEEVVEIGDPGTVTLTSSWTSGLFNSHGQFLTSANQRTITTETTTFTSGSKTQTLTVRGSGSVIRQ